MANDDNLGAKPENIDPFKVLSEQTDAAPDSEKLNKIFEGIEREVPSPSQQRSKSVAKSPAGIKPLTSENDSGGNMMQSTFDPSASVPDYMRGTLDQLGSIQKFLHGRDIQKLQRSQLLKLSRELFEYQYKDMQHLLLLGMDVQKKARFVQYLNATKNLQIKIQNESAAAQSSVIETLFDNRIEAYKNKNNRDAQLTKLLSDSVLDRKQFDASIQDNEAFMDAHVEELNKTARVMITRHLEFLYKTLELFKTKLIESGAL